MHATQHSSSHSVFLNIGGSEGQHVVVFVINSLLFLSEGHSDDSSGLSLLLTSPICFHISCMLILHSSLLLRHSSACSHIKQSCSFPVHPSILFLYHLLINLMSRYTCFITSYNAFCCGVPPLPSCNWLAVSGVCSD